MQNRVAVIAIVVEQDAATDQLNRLLSQAAPYIIGRMGIPYRQRGINLISVAIDAPQEEINALSGKLGRLEGISTKTVYSPVMTAA